MSGLLWKVTVLLGDLDSSMIIRARRNNEQALVYG
jgi:hypothetical protein